MIFAVIVVIVVALLIWATDQIPMQHPLNLIVRVAIILVGILIIAQRAGMV